MLLIWITYYLNDGHFKIDKVFDTEGKALRYIQTMNELDNYCFGYICKELE
jgi:hypothetical protein